MQVSTHLFHIGPGSKCFRPYGSNIPCPAAQPYHRNGKAAIDDMQANECRCVPIKFYYRQEANRRELSTWKTKSRRVVSRAKEKMQVSEFKVVVCRRHDSHVQSEDYS